jgi:plastocyanin
MSRVLFFICLCCCLTPVSLALNSTVKGRIELIKAKVKNGKVDASGVVIWLEPLDAAARPLRRQRQMMDQRNKRFTPHVVVVETGGEVDFPNNDPFFHNVFSIYNGKRFDLGLYASGEARPVTFNRPGISHIFCNIHPQMSAIVIALNTPYHALSNASGSFVIGDVPPGHYRLQVWHERAQPAALATLTQTVQVTANGLDLGVLRVSEEGYIPRPHSNKHGKEYDNPLNQPGYSKR